MSVRLYIGGKPAYRFLSTQSAQEFIDAQSEAVRAKWPMEIRITRERKDQAARQEMPR